MAGWCTADLLEEGDVIEHDDGTQQRIVEPPGRNGDGDVVVAFPDGTTGIYVESAEVRISQFSTR